MPPAMPPATEYEDDEEDDEEDDDVEEGAPVAAGSPPLQAGENVRVYNYTPVVGDPWTNRLGTVLGVDVGGSVCVKMRDDTCHTVPVEHIRRADLEREKRQRSRKGGDPAKAFVTKRHKRKGKPACVSPPALDDSTAAAASMMGLGHKGWTPIGASPLHTPAASPAHGPVAWREPLPQVPQLQLPPQHVPLQQGPLLQPLELSEYFDTLTMPPADVPGFVREKEVFRGMLKALHEAKSMKPIAEIEGERVRCNSAMSMDPKGCTPEEREKKLQAKKRADADLIIWMDTRRRQLAADEMMLVLEKHGDLF
jgi:hypothetical protein